MIKINEKKLCCGCGACSQVCPAGCITMSLDKEGFLYPIIAKDKCIDCGLCESVCPMLGSVEKERPWSSIYAAYANDDALRMDSSSGGIFPLLAKSVLDKGGVVFGAAFDSNLDVHNVMISTEAQLKELQGSKYLQSNTEETFILVWQQLDAGIPVLFSGTGCQIAGLKRFLRKDYEQLLTADVVCHGVPSNKVWRRYLREQEALNDSAAKNVHFRDKSKGWKAYSVIVEFENGKKYEKPFKEDPYMRLFLRDICLRPSCYDCRFKTPFSLADITLGDFWGIQKYLPEMDDDKGCSIVVVHTPRGEDALDRIRPSIVIKEAALGEQSQPMIKRSAKEHPARKAFFKALDRGRPMAELLEITSPTFMERVKRRLRW